MNIPQLVTFAVLMQNGEGILGKAPRYLLEKYDAVQNRNNPSEMLDAQNKDIYDKWMEIWGDRKISNDEA
tara:strand:+ start:68 stop:277 length:210 start_codon:yes stop_codon:yes gene_type:complete